MELYLRYLEKYEMVDGEKTPVGLNQCTGKNEEHVELMQLDKSNTHSRIYNTVAKPGKIAQGYRTGKEQEKPMKKDVSRKSLIK